MDSQSAQLAQQQRWLTPGKVFAIAAFALLAVMLAAFVLAVPSAQVMAQSPTIAPIDIEVDTNGALAVAGGLFSSFSPILTVVIGFGVGTTLIFLAKRIFN